MANRSRFTPQVPQAPAGRKLSSQIVRDMRGLNSTDPFSVLPDSASPYLRNARMYLAEERRQVSISTRPGTRFYTVPVGEDELDSQESTTNAEEESISSTQWIAQKFSNSTTRRLTRAEVNIKKDIGTAPIIVSVFTDNDGQPGVEIGVSSIPNSDVDDDFEYVHCRFIDAPLIEENTDYWLVISIQEEDSNRYRVSTTDDTADAVITTNSGNAWGDLEASINFRVHGSDDGGVKGAVRFYPGNNPTETIFAHGSELYSVDDVTGEPTEIGNSLNVNASRYRFAQFDNKLFIANGLDNLKEYDGTDVTEPGAPAAPFIVVSHKNRLFIVAANDRNRIEFSEIADPEEWEGTSFIYAPAPGSSDPITALISFQDTLVIFTRNDKYVLYGDDLANFEVRQSLGKQGAISQEAVVADENYIYFIASDGKMYRWNGSEDEEISRVIDGDLDDVGNLNESRLCYHNDRVYWFFRPSGSNRFNSTFVYETKYNEWFYDTGRSVNGAHVWGQENNELIFHSDAVGALYYSARRFNDVGKPIAFEYRTNYFDFGRPDNFKQVRRLYLHFRRTNWIGDIEIGTDVDYQDNPRYERISTAAGGSIWGEWTWGIGSETPGIWGSTEEYLRHRSNIPGQATHYQVRVRKNGVDTPVYFIKYSFYYRGRRQA